MHAKISYKLIAVVGGAAVAIIGIFAYLLLGAYQNRLIADLEGYAHQLSETVRSSTRYDMLLNQRESIHQIISTIGEQEGIEKVRIFNKDGDIILSTDSLDEGRMVDQDAEACHACHAADEPLERLSITERTRVFTSADGRRVLGIINPIYNEPSCWQSDCHAHPAGQTVLGVLDITLPLDAVDREMRAGRRDLLGLAALAVVAISGLIFWLAERIVLRPVEQVVEATRRVAGGDLAYTIDVRKTDEIGELARSFNEMTQQLAEAQRQLFQSDKLASVGRLAAGVAHEINNPLTGVLTYSSFLLSRAQDRPELREDLEVIVRETKRCREIVKGLLDFSRQSVPEKRRANLNEIVHHAASIVHNQLSLHRIRLALDLPADLPPVLADVNQIQQVLVNLLVNAGDAIPKEGGTITVETGYVPPEAGGAGAGQLRVVVRDTGRGIAPDHLSKIFDPFFSTKGQKGTGLGLAIVWGIVQEHGGRIDVASTPGRGTTFTVLLPAAPADGQADGQAAEQG